MTQPVCLRCGRPLDEGEVIPPAGWARHLPYDQDMADRICGMIASGVSLKAICESPGMPGIDVVYRWRREQPVFATAYAYAREDAADAFADEIMAIADDRAQDWVRDSETGQWKPDHDHINRARLRVDARKWVAAKLKPQSYGDRVEARLTGEVTTRNVNVNVDAHKLTAEQRELLRATLLASLPAPEEGE